MAGIAQGGAMQFAIFALFLGTFSIGTTEFVIAGLLPEIARDLQIGIPDAGLLVTYYALSVAIGGPLLTLALARMPRKPAALALMGLFIAGHVICGLADSYGGVMAGRVVTAVGHGAFFGLAVVLAAKVAPADRVGKALSFIFAGVAIANIVGVPLGTWIGTTWGWRATFWMVGALATLALAGIIVFVPRGSDGDAKTKSIGAQMRALANAKVMTSFALIFLMMVALWNLNTFIAPYLTEVVGLPAGWLAPVLLGFGVMATVGTLAGGPLADSRPRSTLRWSYTAFALAYALVVLLATQNLFLGLSAVTLTVLPLTLVSTTVQNRVLIGAAAAPELASTLISSVFNTGAAVGSLIGSAALGLGLAYQDLPYGSFAAAALAAILAMVVTAADRTVDRAVADRAA